MSVQSNIKAVHAFISGRVQGVFYRASAYDEAKRLGLKGWVKNLPDGRVELYAEGPAKTVDALIAWCWKGPPAARVDAIEAEELEPTGVHSSFEIHY